MAVDQRRNGNDPRLAALALVLHAGVRQAVGRRPQASDNPHSPRRIAPFDEPVVNVNWWHFPIEHDQSCSMVENPAPALVAQGSLVDGVFQPLAGGEFGLLAGGDFDFFASPRISAFAGGALPDGERAEPQHFNRVAIL